jgi:hypothetical protein
LKSVSEVRASSRGKKKRIPELLNNTMSVKNVARDGINFVKAALNTHNKHKGHHQIRNQLKIRKHEHKIIIK